MAQPSAPIPELESMDVRTDKVVRWIEENVGGRVVDIDPQARWRPVWFATLERDGERVELCVRGDRLDCRHGFPLEHEMHLQDQLHKAGIPGEPWPDAVRAEVFTTASFERDLRRTS